MKITDSAELTELRQSLSRMLSGHESYSVGSGSPDARAREWKLLSQEFGLFEAIADPDVQGDVGRLRLMCTVCERLGGVLSSAAVGSTMTGVGVLAESSEPVAQQLLTEVLAQMHVVAVAPGDAGRPLSAALDGTRTTVSGTMRLVLHADDADVFLVPARIETDEVLVAVRRADGGVSTTLTPTLDSTRTFALVSFDAAPAAIVARSGDAPAAIARLVDTGTLLMAAESLGGARRCFDMTLEFVQVREQFGRTIGSFQALKHRLVDMFVAIEATSALVDYAAAVGDVTDVDPTHFRTSASAAKAYACETFTTVASESIQMHGATGFTWEHQAHRYFKRAQVVAKYWGTNEVHWERVASATLTTSQ
ncbi:acyl-CoA dehydrogenase family protein [Gordonia rhizosphera]|uniref:Putative acyl-CoA dehydrogenase n=1 Tax=Gordonia rhizosphera NBRC 16068 TaxID=1108045 RepID=K6VZN3_9ACTN|nr:acyl-CoA dehydrogenase family protein [Gordonia rhizosphera]GAB92360.1 putative acyl-CoA dehydrogenase [Gordonia rhizosphera NBRC 16068]